eukprot:TRINITY_DN3495_c0_g1_i3.p1 TRINITY_DN3495_c0_g1~~TRINITY_DN3495_c0_g1_i3.p1  ORF type:complete len:808 (-),score=241.77 TRINITY_DN3495_c0_g1_i3:207-2630(-)
MATTQLTAEEEQEKLMEQAKGVVNTEAFHMKRCLDNAKLMDALKHASNMISELRTSLLSPKTYYSLYMTVFDHLRHLEIYLYEEKHGKKMSELYELVQYAGNILPRLYLLATVGSVYIKSNEAPAKDVLRDLVEMCRGVQHPTRGLFLRNYLSEMTKDKLPDSGSPYEGKGGDVKDGLDFILLNFTEMNKLWVRMQHQGPVRDKERRENERLELRILVGKNLSRMSQLEGIDVAMYTESVLPRVLEQIINCKDRIAQQYLMEVLIQVFPDEFHLATLEQVLAACGQLLTGVDVKAIIVSLIDRLAQFAVKSPDTIPNEVDIFNTFFLHVGKVIDQRPNMEVHDVLSLEVSLLNLSLKCYPQKLEYVDKVIGFCVSYLSGLKSKETTDYTKPVAVKQIVNLLTVPIDNYKNVLTLLKISAYPQLQEYLSYTTRKKVSVDLVKNVIENGTIIGEPDQAEKFLALIQTLIEDSPDQPDRSDVDPEDFQEEQNMVASVVNMFDNDDPGKLYKIYLTARKAFIAGGQDRMKHTLFPLIFRALRLVTKIKDQRSDGTLTLDDDDWGKIGKKLFQFVHDTISQLKENKELCEWTLRLFLQASQSASYCDFETIAYEFITQAFTIYEEDIAESKQQFNALIIILSTLRTLSCFSDENNDTLVGKSAQYCKKLLKKPDQSRAASLVSHLFWITNTSSSSSSSQQQHKQERRDETRVFECLQMSLKIAGGIMDAGQKTNAFVEILNEYIYYLDTKCGTVPPSHIPTLIQLINTNLSAKEVDPNSPEIIAINTYYQNTLKYIQQKKESDSAYAHLSVQ